MRALLAAVVALACFPTAASAGFLGIPFLDGTDAPTGPLLGFGAFAGSPTNSYTRVREDTDRGTYLYFQDDLGVVVVGETSVELGWRFDADDALGFAFDYVFIGGGRTTHQDLEFNATTLQGGTELDESPLSVHWFVLELQYERTIFRFGEGDRGFLAFDLGVRYDDIDWRFSKETLAPATAGREAGEDFRTQALPIPVLGLAARFPIASGWDAVASARGSRINHLSSGRAEGGIVYVSESFIEATLGVVFHATPGVQLGLGYRFLYVDFDGESREDGNLIGLFTHGAFVNVQVAF